MKMLSALSVIMMFLLQASFVMAEDSSLTQNSAAPDTQEDSTWGRILLALKYSETTSLYFNPKLMLGKIDLDYRSEDVGDVGIGFIVDGGLGLTGYKAGIGYGVY